MQFYKKNPEIKHKVTVQGTVMDDDTIVCGKEFAPFADPATFPGIPPSLVVVPFEELNGAQQVQVKDFAEKQALRPPRHLGITTSDNLLHEPSKSKFKISGMPDLPKDIKERRAKAEPVETPEVKGPEKPLPEGASDSHSYLAEAYKKSGKMQDAERIEELLGDRLPPLTKMYSAEEMVDTFPGVTERNAAKVLTKFRDLEELAGAANSELRKAGIMPNYFNRVRTKAAAEHKAHKESE